MEEGPVSYHQISEKIVQVDFEPVNHTFVSVYLKQLLFHSHTKMCALAVYTEFWTISVNRLPHVFHSASPHSRRGAPARVLFSHAFRAQFNATSIHLNKSLGSRFMQEASLYLVWIHRHAHHVPRTAMVTDHEHADLCVNETLLSLLFPVGH